MESRQLKFNFENDSQINLEDEEKERNTLADNLNIYGEARKKMHKTNGAWMIEDQTVEAYAQMLQALDENDTDLPYYQGQK